MSETNLPFEIRISSAGRYYTFLERAKNSKWSEVLLEVESNKDFGIPEVLVLLDPTFYVELNATDPRGNKGFPPALPSSKCRSREVWGYPCPFEGRKIHVDHMFPRSKGGVTHIQNAMYLCAEHNMSMHTDIHLIPWETFLTNGDWILNSLSHLKNFADKTTNEKLYLPTRQLNQI